MRPEILVVDDEADIRRIIALALEREGYRVRLASDAVDAFRALAEGLPDLIVLDVMMPPVDGLETVRRLRADAGTAHLPVLLVSARARSLGTASDPAAEVDGVLEKPFAPLDLVKKVETVLATTSARRGRTPRSCGLGEPQSGPTIDTA